MSIDTAMIVPPELRRGNAPQQLDNTLLSMHQFSTWHVLLLHCEHPSSFDRRFLMFGAD